MCVKVVNVRRSAYDVYIGRAGKGKNGTYGNPVAIGGKCPVCKDIHGTAGSTLPCYELDLQRKLATDAQFQQAFATLVVKAIAAAQQNQVLKLGCFCKDERGNGACHGDVLATYIKKFM